MLDLGTSFLASVARDPKQTALVDGAILYTYEELYGCISSIVPRVQMATDTRMDVEYIVTEYGCVNLRGKSTRERALGLIGIAHPNFREELMRHAKSINLI